MPPTVSPPIAAPPDDPIRSALAEPQMRGELTKQALAVVFKRLPDRPRPLREELAEEIVQTAIERALQARASFDPAAGSPAGWVHGIVKLVSFEQCRKLLGQPAQPTSDPGAWEKLEARMNPDRDPTELRGLLNRLSSEEQNLVVWHHLEELSHVQISEKLGISPGACRVRLCRALTELKRIANDKEGAR